MHPARISIFALIASLLWLVTAAGQADDHRAPISSETSAAPDAPGAIIGYRPTTNLRDPSDRYAPAPLPPPARVQPKGERRITETPEEQAARLALPCQQVIYRNTCYQGCYVFVFGGQPPGDNLADDLTLPIGSTSRFICAAQAVTSTYQPFGGPPAYNLKQQLWSDCPENPGAIMVAQGEFLAIPNDGADHVTTITIDPPYLDDDDTVWQLLQSDHPAVDITIANNTTDPGDIGSTQISFAVSDGLPGCDLFSIGYPYPYAFEMLLYGGPGPAGSCCDLNSGTCTDGLLQSACNNLLTQTWRQSPCSLLNCIACNPVCNIGDAADLENEPDCFTNYNDTTNRGCNNLTLLAYSTYFTPLNCNQSGCGRTGTYTYLNNYTVNGSSISVTENRRDADHYRLDLTQDTRVTWTVNGKFPSQALIAFTLQQTNNITSPIRCPEFIIEDFDGSAAPYNGFTARQNANSLGSATPCQDAVATAILSGRNDPGGAGPFRYMLIARPATTKLADTALCGLPYTMNLSCEPVAPLPTGACCTKNGCVQISAMACLLLSDTANFYQGDGKSCPSTCASIPINDLCPNAIVLT